MAQPPEWLYDETQTFGTDYANTAEALRYQERSRNQDRENVNQFIIDFLSLDPGKIIVDLGAGFGSFALAAAPHCKKVIAVDVSHAMLDIAAKTASERGLHNIEFHVAGFLTYDHTEPLVDGIVCRNALHHLPDFWKQVALNRMSAMLKPDGLMHFEDQVLSFDVERYMEVLDDIVERNRDNVDAEGRNIMAVLMKDEYPTYDWIMESMIQRAGFSILNSKYGRSGFVAFYQCQR